MGVVILFFLQNTGLYNTGLSAIVQGTARLVQTVLKLNGVDATTVATIYNILFWCLYFVLNIPLFIFGYFKIGKTFTLLTVVFAATNSLTGFCLSYIPGIDQILLFGNTIPGAPGSTPGTPNNVLVYYGIYVIPFYTRVTESAAG